MARCLVMIGMAVALLASGSPMASADSCNATSLEKAMQRALVNFSKPSVRAKLEKAKAEWAEDQDFDDEDAARYLAAVALYHDISRNLGGDAIDDACASYQKSIVLFQLIEDAE